MGEAKRDLDVVIIGAGPAGLSAGIWCRDLGLRAIILEKEPETGGQLLSIYNPITNYPGLRAENGRQLRDRFLETAENYGVEILVSTEVVDIETEKMTVTTAAGARFSGQAIILATGVRRRRLNIPGESEFVGKGILESGARDRELTRGKTVAIIGGGDAALENALILSDYAGKVYVVHRREQFSAREDFVRRAAAMSSIRFILNATAAGIYGRESVESIELVDQETNMTRILPVENVLIRVGVEPNSGLVAGAIKLTSEAYIVTDDLCRTTRDRILAAGDVANPEAPTIATAVGTGAMISKLLSAG